MVMAYSGKSGEENGQRQRGQHQEDIGKERKYFIDPAAKVAGDQANNDRDHHGHNADDKAHKE